MKFLALLKKELRECLPWIALAAGIVLTFGTIEFLSKRAPGAAYFHYRFFNPFSEVDRYMLITYPTESIGPILTLTAIGLGITLAIRQFWMPHYFKEWNYLLHRPMDRGTVLTAKLLTGFLVITVPLGLVWTYLFWQGTRPGFLPVPLPARHFVEGWLIVTQGLVFYLGAALAGLSRAKWYTTKLVSLAFALWIIGAVAGQRLLVWVVIIIVTAAAVMLYQLFNSFLKREF